MIWEFAYNLFEWINVRSSKPKTDEGWRAQETKKNIRFLFCVRTNIHQSRLNHFASPFDRVASECVVPKKNETIVTFVFLLCCIVLLCCAVQSFARVFFFQFLSNFFHCYLFVCVFFLAVRNTKSPSFIIPLKSNINSFFFILSRAENYISHVHRHVRMYTPRRKKIKCKYCLKSSFKTSHKINILKREHFAKNYRVSFDLRTWWRNGLENRIYRIINKCAQHVRCTMYDVTLKIA